MKKQIVLIIGPSGSGKSFLQKRMIEKGFSEVVSTTTREIREGEIDNKDYFFKKSDADFFQDKFIEYNKFGNFLYGTSEKEFYKSEKIVHVVEPFGARDIINYFSNNKEIIIKVIFLNIDKETCRENLLKGKTEISQRDLSRLNRDFIDNIDERMKSAKIEPNIVINSMPYDFNQVYNNLLK